MIHKGLSDLKVLTPQSQERLKSAESFLEQTCKIAVRQLKSARISSKDRRYFDKLPSSIGSIVQPKKEEKQRPKVTIIADVYANQSEAMVVQAAVGKIDLMIVACPMTRGRAFLAVGPVLSFYEFKRPMGDRLTDEKWLQLSDAPIRPDRPEWYASLIERSKDVSIDGNITGLKRLTDYSAIAGRPDWSPDGKKIAFAARIRNRADIYVMNTDGTQVQSLTANPALDMEPSWSPDGERIAFFSGRDGQNEIYVMNADGSGVERLTDNPAADTRPRWSPNGKRIVFTSKRDGNGEIYVMNADGSGVERLTNNPAADYLPSWSPTGEQIAFVSNRDSIADIYIMNVDGSGQKNLTVNEAADTSTCSSLRG
jgi:Tol biopolymer transport system component/phage gp46-like protein